MSTLSPVIPDWRAKSAPGLTLAQARALSQSGPPSSSKAPLSLDQTIRPSARDRWLATNMEYYTPRNVENIIRGAMSGYLMSQWLMFDLMERTWPRLNKNLNEIKNGAKALPKLYVPFSEKDEKPTPEAIKRAKLAEKCFAAMRPDRTRLERDLDDTIYDILDCLGKGISVSEILWDQRLIKVSTGARTPGGQGGQMQTSTLWVPRATRWVHQRYYGFPAGTQYEEALMLNSIEVGMVNPDFAGTNPPLWVPMPDDQFIVSIMPQKSGHPVTGSMLSILGFWWSMANFTWEWAFNFAQIFGAPIRYATFDPATASQDTINVLQTQLRRLGSLGCAIFPAGTEIKLLEALKTGANNPQFHLLEKIDIIADLVILGQTLTSEVRSSGGNRALGQVHQDVRGERIQNAADTAGRILTEGLMRSFCLLNFGDDDFTPTLKLATMANKNLVEQAQRYQIILQTPGVKVSKQQYYEDNELVIPDEFDDVLEAQSAPARPQNPGEVESEASKVAAQAKGNRRGANPESFRGTDKLIDNVLESLTHVEARWLGAVKPVFADLLAKAKDSSLSDADFMHALARAQKQMPELFDKLDANHLANAMEGAMGAAAFNGAVRGYMVRTTRSVRSVKSV